MTNLEYAQAYAAIGWHVFVGSVLRRVAGMRRRLCNHCRPATATRTGKLTRKPAP